MSAMSGRSDESALPDLLLEEINQKVYEELRTNAVRLVGESGLPKAQIAENMGITRGALEALIAQDQRQSGEETAESDGDGLAQLQQELAWLRPEHSRLRQENARLRLQL